MEVRIASRDESEFSEWNELCTYVCSLVGEHDLGKKEILSKLRILRS